MADKILEYEFIKFKYPFVNECSDKLHRFSYANQHICSKKGESVTCLYNFEKTTIIDFKWQQFLLQSVVYTENTLELKIAISHSLFCWKPPYNEVMYEVKQKYQNSPRWSSIALWTTGLVGMSKVFTPKLFIN